MSHYASSIPNITVTGGSVVSDEEEWVITAYQDDASCVQELLICLQGKIGKEQEAVIKLHQVEWKLDGVSISVKKQKKERKVKMKIQKRELEKITQDAAKIGLLAFVSLLKEGCEVPGVYEVVENFLKRTEDLRKEMGLEALVPEEITGGSISSIVKAKQLTRSQNSARNEMVEVEDLVKEDDSDPTLEQKLKKAFTGVVNKNVN